MPLYDFRCEACGDFEAWRTLAELGTPMLCPNCETVTKRIFSPPNVNLNSSRLSLRRQEVKEPQVVNRELEPKPQPSKVAHGRPWMVSH
jgi:putative FmdB family regulatory protein